MNGFKEDIQKKILGTQSHLVVLSAGSKGFESSDTLLNEIMLTEELRKRRLYIGAGNPTQGKQSAGCVVKGIDPDKEKKITLIEQYVIEGSCPVYRT